MKASDKANARESNGAVLAASATAVESLKMSGSYRVSLMRVDANYRLFADDLVRQINALRGLAQGWFLISPIVRRKIERLTEQLRLLPRHEVWADVIQNVVTTVGGNQMLDTYLAGSGYTAAIVMGLKGTGTAVAADTQASHASWLEVGAANAPTYSGTRKTPSFSAAANKVKATSAAVAFTFTSGGTVAGCFINQGGSSTIDNTTGTLVSAGDFTGGNKVVASTDVLNVTYQLGV